MSDSEEFKYLFENDEQFKQELLKSNNSYLEYLNKLFTLEDIQTRNVDSWCYWHNEDGTRGWPGNILLHKSSNPYVPWKTGHAGIIDSTAKYSIEANTNGALNSGSSSPSLASEESGVMRVKIELWGTKVGNYKDERPNSVCLSVKGETVEQMYGAAYWAEKQIGKPYSLDTNLNNLSSFYCSKLVYLAWKSQGKDIRRKGTDGWLNWWVFPMDFIGDKTTILNEK